MVVLGMLDDGIISNFRGSKNRRNRDLKSLQNWDLCYHNMDGTKPAKVELKVNPMNLYFFLGGGAEKIFLALNDNMKKYVKL